MGYYVQHWYTLFSGDFFMKRLRNRRFSLLLCENSKLAKLAYPLCLSDTNLSQLRHLTETFLMSLKLGDLQLLSHGWYVTHSGLLRLARRQKCSGIQVEAVDSLCDR